MNRSGLFIGTSGWSYRHWAEIFYPKDLKPDRYLEFYITKFSCVELNSSFYHLPLQTTVEGWIRRTPEIFRFCPKMSRLITHQLQLVNAGDAVWKFFDVFNGMKEKLGPVLIQLPPGLQYDRLLIADFFNTLKNTYGHFRFAVETRNKSWINDDFLDLLSRFRIALVIADSGRRYPYYEAVTSDFIYLRFHGREQLYASDYSEDVLRSYSCKIVNWLADGKEVWAFFNNDYNGFAIKNAERLKELVNLL